MSRIRTLLAECGLIGVISCSIGWAWLYLTGSRTLTVGAVIGCALVSVAASLAVEALAKAVRRRRRPASPRHRKAGV